MEHYEFTRMKIKQERKDRMLILTPSLVVITIGLVMLGYVAIKYAPLQSVEPEGVDFLVGCFGMIITFLGIMCYSIRCFQVSYLGLGIKNKNDTNKELDTVDGLQK